MNMEIIGPLLLSFIAGLSTLIGCIFIFFKIKKVGEFICFSLSFSMTIMILVSIFDLMPNSINIIYNEYGKIYGIIFIILTFLLGYLTISKINSKISSNNNSLYKIGILSMLSLMLHNFPEGIAVFISAVNDFKIGIKLAIAIILHNIPEGISIAVPLYYGGKSRGSAIKLTFISGIAEPIGALLSYIFLRNIINEIFLSFILLFVSGLMISLSINDIYNEIKKYHNLKYRYYGYILGIILFLLLYLL